MKEIVLRLAMRHTQQTGNTLFLSNELICHLRIAMPSSQMPPRIVNTKMNPFCVLTISNKNASPENIGNVILMRTVKIEICICALIQ